jgi:O-antigen/teichoic acid export membrane protein
MMLGFVATVILARHLGANGFGIYAWALAWMTVLQLVTTLGFDTLSVREVAAQKALAAWPAMRGLLRSAPLIVFCASSIVALGVIAAGFALISTTQRATFLIAIAVVPVLALTNVREGVMQGLGQVVPSRFPEDIFRPLLFIVFLLISWNLFGVPVTAPTAMVLQGVAILFAFLAGLILVRKALPAKLLSGVNAAPMQLVSWIKQGLSFMLLRAITTLLSQIDVIIVGILRGPTQVALYATAARMAAIVGIAEFAVNAAFLPVASRIFTEDGVERLRLTAPLVALGGVTMSAILAVPLIVFAPFALHFFGNSFAGGVFALRVLSASFVLSAVCGLNIALLSMTRHTNSIMIGTGAGLLANVALNVALVPSGGADGAAIAWLLTVLIWNVILQIQVRRILGITSSPFALLPIIVTRLTKDNARS